LFTQPLPALVHPTTTTTTTTTTGLLGSAFTDMPDVKTSFVLVPVEKSGEIATYNSTGERNLDLLCKAEQSKAEQSNGRPSGARGTAVPTPKERSRPGFFLFFP
jgi:hypothetical protein